MRLKTAGAWLAGVLLTVVACSHNGSSDSGSGSSSGTGNPIEDTASAWATAYCNRLFACLPFASQSRMDGANQAECVQRKTGYLKRSLSAPGSSADLSKQNACNAALSTVSCEAFLDFKQGGDGTKVQACATYAPGAKQNGDGCAYGAQCASGYCASPEGSCGRCAPFKQAGESCFDGPCDFGAGLVCDGAQCVRGRRRGDTCGTVRCFDNYICVAGTCRSYFHLNEACDPNAGNCSYAVEGTVCSNQTNSCEAIDTSATAGQVCGLGVPTGGMVNCVAGTLCDMTTPTTANQYSGRCVTGSAAQLGETCLFARPGMNGSACAGEDLQCFNGRCVVADPATCM